MKMKKLTALSMAAAMMVAMGVPAVAATNGATDQDYTLTFMADPNVVSSGFVYEPVNYTIPAGTSEDMTLGEILEDNGVEFQGSTSYITGMKCADAKGFELSDKQKEKYPVAAFDTRIMVDPASAAGQDEWLSEKESTGYAGWMMYVDNVTSVEDSSQPYGTYYYSLGSSIADLEKYGILEDGNVTLEMFFSLNMGADIGMNDSSLPENIIEGDGYISYDWSGSSVPVSKIDKADRTELVQAMADTTDKTSSNYVAARTVLKNLQASQRNVDTVANRLNK